MIHLDAYDNMDNFKNGLNDDELKFKPFGDLITEKTDISPKIIDQVKLINTGLNIENCSLEIYKVINLLMILNFY
jgi:hypothetical protein